MSGLDFIMGTPSSCFFSSACTCVSVNTFPVSAICFSKADRRFLNDYRFWSSHTERTPDKQTKIPHLRSSLETRTWPKAGCSKGKSCDSCLASSMRFLMLGGLASASVNQGINAICFHGSLIAIKSIARKPHHLASAGYSAKFGWLSKPILCLMTLCWTILMGLFLCAFALDW